MRSLIFVATLFLSLGAGPATKPALRLKANAPEVARVAFDASEVRRSELAKGAAKAIALVADRLRAAEAGRVVAGGTGGVSRDGGREAYTFGSAAEKSAMVSRRKDDLAKAKAAVAAAKAGTLLLNDNLTEDGLRVGRVGEVFDLRVQQIIGDHKFRASVSVFSDKAGSGGQIERVDVMVDGLAVGNLVDGSDVKVAGQAFAISRTEHYITVTGAARTVLVLEPFDLRDWVEPR